MCFKGLRLQRVGVWGFRFRAFSSWKARNREWEFGNFVSKLAKILVGASSKNSYGDRTYNSSHFSQGSQQGWAVSDIGFFCDLTGLRLYGRLQKLRPPGVSQVFPAIRLMI